MASLIFINRFYAPDISATSQMLTDLTVEMASNGLDVKVICSKTLYNDTNVTLPPRESLNKVEVIRVPSTRFGRGRVWSRLLDYATFYLSMLLKIMLVAKKGDWVIAKTDPPLMSIPLVAVAFLKRARLANWLQDIFPEIAESAGFSFKVPFIHRNLMRLLYYLRDRSLNWSDFNVVLSKEMKTLLVERGIVAEKLQIIPNWSDPEAIKPLAISDNPKRQQWGLENKFVVGYSGNMGIAHDLDTIVEAASLLKEESNLVFLMIGAGFRKNFMIVEVEKRGLTDSIIFKPYQPRKELSESLGCADVHLVSLRPNMEGLIVPSKFYGVCAAGKPVIYLGSSESYIGRTIRQHNCGIVVEGDGQQLAAAILNYARNPDLVREQGASARQNIGETTTVENASNHWQSRLEDSPVSQDEHHRGRV